MKNKEEEKTRFNALTQENAVALASSFDGQDFAMRTCWNCNGGHEHLKESMILCFACGIKYVGGFPYPILGKRMRGEEITNEDMNKYEKALEDVD